MQNFKVLYPPPPLRRTSNFAVPSCQIFLMTLATKYYYTTILSTLQRLGQVAGEPAAGARGLGCDIRPPQGLESTVVTSAPRRGQKTWVSGLVRWLGSPPQALGAWVVTSAPRRGQKTQVSGLVRYLKFIPEFYMFLNLCMWLHLLQCGGDKLSSSVAGGGGNFFVQFLLQYTQTENVPNTPNIYMYKHAVHLSTCNLLVY